MLSGSAVSGPLIRTFCRYKNSRGWIAGIAFDVISSAISQLQHCRNNTVDLRVCRKIAEVQTYKTRLFNLIPRQNFITYRIGCVFTNIQNTVNIRARTCTTAPCLNAKAIGQEPCHQLLMYKAAFAISQSKRKDWQPVTLGIAEYLNPKQSDKSRVTNC